jgi:hypothetical protein
MAITCAAARSPGSHFLRKLAHRRALEHYGDLVGKQDHQQHRSHQQGGEHDLPQNVASEDFPQRMNSSQRA